MDNILRNIQENGWRIDPAQVEQLQRILAQYPMDESFFMLSLESQLFNSNSTHIHMGIIKKFENSLVMNQEEKEKEKEQNRIRLQSHTKQNTGGYEDLLAMAQKTQADETVLREVKKGGLHCTRVLCEFNEWLPRQNHLRRREEVKVEGLVENREFQGYGKAESKAIGTQITNRFHQLEAYFREAMVEQQLIKHDFDSLYTSKDHAVVFARLIPENKDKAFLLDRPDLDHMVHLDVTRVEECQVFPNQHLVLEGVFEKVEHSESKMKKSTFYAHRIHTKSSLANSQEEDIQEKQQLNQVLSLSSPHFQIMVVCGPYSFSDSLSYAPLEALISSARQNNPDVLVMMGPWLDHNNSLLQTGVVRLGEQVLGYQQLQDHLVQRVATELGRTHPHIQIVMSSSLHDIHNCYPLPVPPAHLQQVPNNLRQVGNPSSLLVDGDNVVGQINSEVVLSMLKSSLFKTKQSPPPNRVEMSLAHLIHQQSYLPVHPSEELLDMAQLSRLCMDDDVPSLLLCPCAFNPFVKQVDSTLLINPGPLVKANQTGCFALVTIYKDSFAKTANRTRVEIRSLL